MHTSQAPSPEVPFWAYVAARVDALQEWTLAWSPAVVWHWMLRHKTAAFVIIIFLLSISAGAARAYADPGTGAGSGGDPIIAWMGIKDSHGVPVAKYTLTMNTGGWDPSEKPYAFLTSMYYEGYLIFATSALWLIKFVLSFEWLGVFTEPFKAIGEGITTAMDRFGLLPTAIAIFSIVFAFTILSGKIAKAYSNAAMGLVMIALAGTIFANVLGDLVGQDGLLAKGRDTGLEIASTVSGGAMTKNGSKANVDDLTASLADRFLRAPTQMINFGMVSDSISRKCEEAWSNGIKNGKGDKLKDDMKLCDKDKGRAMHKESMKPATAMLTAVAFCAIMSLVLIAFACYFTWHVIRSAVHAMMFAALAPPAFAVGVIPGGPQTFAWKTVLDCIMAYLAMIVFTAGFGGYNAVLDTVFRKYASNAYQAIFLTTIVLAFGFAFFGPIRKMFDQSRDGLASKLGSGNASGMSGQGWLSKAADMSRIKQEVSSWRHRGSGSGAGSGDREAGRVDTAEPMKEEPETLTTPAAQDVSFLSGPDAAAAHERLAEAHQMTGGAPSESVSGPRQSPVSLVEWSGQSSSGGNGGGDPLARAIRLSRAAAGGERSTLYVPPGTRHSLSEAA